MAYKPHRRGFGMVLAVLTALACIAAVVAPVTLAAARSGQATPTTWVPDRASYGVGTTKNVDVRMSDGNVLRADVYFPTDPGTGQAAAGPFPVLLTQTPYGKAGPLTVIDNYLIQRGYIEAVVDIRGRGASEGFFDPFAEREIQDSVELVDWGAMLPNSTAEVGLVGASYLGINQFLTAAAVGPDSPLKAIFPVVASNDNYRDLTNVGGIQNQGFTALIGDGLLPALGLTQPVTDNNGDPGEMAAVEAQHAAYLNYLASGQVSALTGGDITYDGPFWQSRAVASRLASVVRNGIPAFLVGGWYDLFQRGEPLNYVGLQNAFAGRPTDAPMRRGQRVTGRYQLLQGPWFHTDNGTSADGVSVDLEQLQLQWFDQWLKHQRTGIDETKTPLHIYEIGGKRWADTATWPPAPATTYWLDRGPSGSGAPSTNDGVLSTASPTAAAGSDPIVWTGTSSPCDSSTNSVAAPLRCAGDDRSAQVGPGSLTYTTAPFTEGRTIAGPINASISLTSTTPDAEVVATVEDVAPDGSSNPLTFGAQLGSFRALSADRSWYDDAGKLLAPYHPFTRESTKPIASGEVARLDIEVFATFARINPGHRLRLTVQTSDAPQHVPTPTQTKDLVGGVYQLQRNTAAASFIDVPLADPGQFATPCQVCVAP
jgi:putative CocE/NonD family hydrolase